MRKLIVVFLALAMVVEAPAAGLADHVDPGNDSLRAVAVRDLAE